MPVLIPRTYSSDLRCGCSLYPSGWAYHSKPMGEIDNSSAEMRDPLWRACPDEGFAIFPRSPPHQGLLPVAPNCSEKVDARAAIGAVIFPFRHSTVFFRSQLPPLGFVSFIPPSAFLPSKLYGPTMTVVFFRKEKRTGLETP